MTFSTSPVGQNFVQVYVFVRQHRRFCHSSFVSIKKRRAFALLNISFLDISHPNPIHQLNWTYKPLLPYLVAAPSLQAKTAKPPLVLFENN